MDLIQLTFHAQRFKALANAVKRRLVRAAKRLRVPMSTLRGTPDGHRLSCLTGRYRAISGRIIRLLEKTGVPVRQTPLKAESREAPPTVRFPQTVPAQVKPEQVVYPPLHVTCEEKTYTHALQSRVLLLIQEKGVLSQQVQALREYCAVLLHQVQGLFDPGLVDDPGDPPPVSWDTSVLLSGAEMAAINSQREEMASLKAKYLASEVRTADTLAFIRQAAEGCKSDGDFESYHAIYRRFPELKGKPEGKSSKRRSR